MDFYKTFMYFAIYLQSGVLVLLMLQYICEPVWSEHVFRYLVKQGKMGILIFLLWPILATTAIIGIYQYLKNKP